MPLSISRAGLTGCAAHTWLAPTLLGIKLKKAKRNGKEGIKFKLRMGTYLYTLFQSESSKIQKVRDALPPGLTKKAVDYQENNA